MRLVNVTGPAFRPTMQSVDNHERDLRDDVAKIAFKKLMSETTAKDLAHKTPVMAKHIAKLHATLAWDFADAFMRERYERESIARSEMQANIPDHLGQLNL